MTYLDKDESCFLHKKDAIAEGEEMNPCPLAQECKATRNGGHRTVVNLSAH